MKNISGEDLKEIEIAIDNYLYILSRNRADAIASVLKADKEVMNTLADIQISSKGNSEPIHPQEAFLEILDPELQDQLNHDNQRVVVDLSFQVNANKVAKNHTEDEGTVSYTYSESNTTYHSDLAKREALMSNHPGELLYNGNIKTEKLILELPNEGEYVFTSSFVQSDETEDPAFEKILTFPKDKMIYAMKRNIKVSKMSCVFKKDKATSNPNFSIQAFSLVDGPQSLSFNKKFCSAITTDGEEVEITDDTFNNYYQQISENQSLNLNLSLYRVSALQRYLKKIGCKKGEHVHDQLLSYSMKVNRELATTQGKVVCANIDEFVDEFQNNISLCNIHCPKHLYSEPTVTSQ